ncbi:MAG: SRPBCC domain-containing protein [Woeseia sp.]
MTDDVAKISALRLEISIAAPPAAVWQSLTTDIGAWWPAEFYAGGVEGKRTFRLEAKPGGHMREDWQDGGGVLWATVVMVEPRVRLQVIGYAFPGWGGPSQWFGNWELRANGTGTRLKFQEHAIGRVSGSLLEEKEKGWRFLWDVMKARLEGTRAPVWSD